MYKIANFFIKNKIKKITIVCEKNYITYCIIWAAYKAGITFCMLNNNLPNKRLKECFDIFCPDIIISDKNFSNITSFNNILSGNILSKAKSNRDASNLHSRQVNSAMCVLFTSGSTGKPKGVVILRKAFEEVIEWARNNLGMNAEDVVGQYCDLSFDMGLCDVFLALSSGAELVAIKELFKLAPGRIVKERKITWIYAVPTLMDIFQKQEDFEKGNLDTLKRIGFGGAPLYRRNMEYICNNNPNLTIYNTYGPTETTIFTSAIIFAANAFDAITEKSVCLGTPIKGVTYETKKRKDGLMELVVLGNHCLAGYLSSDDQFDIMNAKSKERFETGDIVYLKNDNYYFVARKDNQVKVRGNRINLDAVDSQISALRLRSVTMVIDEKLVAFYEGNLSNAKIRKILSKYLPPNSIPDEFIHRDNIPLNKNGKNDKSKLLKYYRELCDSNKTEE